MKKIFIFVGCIVCLVLFTSCHKTKTDDKTATKKNEDKVKISKEQVQKLIEDAEERLSNDLAEPVKEVKYDPFYYKKLPFENRKEFIEDMLDEDEQKRFYPDKVVVLQIYYKHREEVESMIYVKEKGNWKFLRRFK